MWVPKMVPKQVYATLLAVSATTTLGLVAFFVAKDPIMPTSIAVETRFIVCWVMSVAFMLRYRSLSHAVTFALVAFIVKKDPLPITLAVEARFFVCWVMSVAFMIRYRSERSLKWFGPVKNRIGLMLRGALTCSFVTLWWASLPVAPLGDCFTIIYCAPLLTVFLSNVIFGQKVQSVFPMQALLATLGLCFIVRPPLLTAALDLGPAYTSGGGNYTLALVAMVISAFTPIVTRQTKEASWIEVEHVTNFMAVFVLNPIAYCTQQFAKGEPLLAMPAVAGWEVCLILLAACMAVACVAMQTRGNQVAESAKSSMFNYLEIPFAYMLQTIGTQSAVSINAMIGASLVLSACLLGAFAQYRTSRSAKKAAAAKELNTERGDLEEEIPKLMSEVDAASATPKHDHSDFLDAADEMAVDFMVPEAVPFL